ncbi:MAG: septum formation initiator family protein [Gemmatimonadaceae bacterium]|nr:septum formation initiator family protein [Gemmatimonadaceae bacterium]
MKRLVWLLVIAAAAFFALQGGEYSTQDLFKQRERKEKMQVSLDSLRRQVDSLKAVKKAIETDPAVQERLAREEFGMVRGDKELLYRFVQDSVVVPGGR